jgi:putative redox protein
MLVALAGCTGMDIVSILEKMRVKLDDFKVRVDGTKADEIPNPYIKMHIVYEFWGEDLPYDKLEKAINLSQEKYCGVLAVYKKVMPVTWSILTHHSKEREIFNLKGEEK